MFLPCLLECDLSCVGIPPGKLLGPTGTWSLSYQIFFLICSSECILIPTAFVLDFFRMGSELEFPLECFMAYTERFCQNFLLGFYWYPLEGEKILPDFFSFIMGLVWNVIRMGVPIGFFLWLAFKDKVPGIQWNVVWILFKFSALIKGI